MLFWTVDWLLISRPLEMTYFVPLGTVVQREDK